MDSINLVLIAVTSALLLFTIVLCFMYFMLYKKHKKLIKYMGVISNAAKSVRYGNLTKRIKFKSDKKINQIFKNINNMIESIEDREAIVKSYQQELQDQKEYLESIFNSLTDGLIIINKNYQIMFVNPIVLDWMNCTQKEIIGKNFTELFSCSCNYNCKDLKKTDNCPLFNNNLDKSVSNVEITVNKLDETRFFGLSTCKLSNKNDETNYVLSLHDVTKLKEIDRLRDDFIATLTHDLRVPILAETNTLKLFSKGIFGAINDKQEEAINNILESNQGLLTIVNSLLDTYKFESGEVKLYNDTTDISKIITSCIAEFESSALKNEQNLYAKIPDKLPKLMVDKNEITRVLRNLINNAITYTQKGGVITIGAQTKDDYLIVNIKDNGRGIAEKDLNNIFNRYFSKAKKFRKIGTGLGLYLSKQIIEKHNGKIWVESELEKGSTFYFSLPL